MRQVKTAALVLAIGLIGTTGSAKDPGPARTPADHDKAGTAGGAWTFQGPAPLEFGQVENIGSNNPVAGAVQSIVAHPTNPDILYVGAVNGGVWKTSNATSTSPTWTPLTDAQTSLSIGAIAFDTNDPSRNTVVAGIGRRSSYGSVGGTRTGLLRTVNAGANWTVLAGLAGQNISSVAAHGATIVASVNFSDANTCGTLGIFRSTDTGANFSQVGIGSGVPAGRSFDLAVDPAAPGTMYTSIISALGCSGVANGLFKSTDGGANWTRVSSAAIQAQLTDSTSNVKLSVGAAGAVFVGIANSGRLAGVFRSTDGGANWTRLDSPSTNEGGSTQGLHPGRRPVEPIPAPGERIKPGGQGSLHFSMQADLHNSNIVYLGGDRQPSGFPNGIGAVNFSGRLFRLDASQSPGSQSTPLTHCSSTAWVSCNTVSTTNNSSPHADSRDMAMDANGNLVEADDGGVYRRTNPAGIGDWFPVNGSLGPGELHDASYDTVSNIVLSGNQDIGSGEQATSGSTTWRTVNQGDGGDTVVDIASVAGRSVRYTAAQNLFVFQRRTVNASNTVTSTIFPSLAGGISGQFNTPVELNAVDPLRLAFLGSNGIFESFNQGTSVSLVSSSVAPGFLGDPVAYGGFSGGVPNSDVLYVSVGNTVRLRTTGGGSLVPTAGLPGIASGDDVVDIVLDPAEWQTAYVVTSSGRVYRTTNAGASWTEVSGDIPLQQGNAIEYASGPEGDSVYASGREGLFRMLTSNPGDWQRYGAGLPRALIYDLDFDPADDVLMASTMGRGTWLIGDASCQTEACDGIDNDCDGVVDEVCATCGNGVVEPPEVCDDGNTVGGDGCSADCSSDESCGNGIVDPGEMCDDGNTSSNDGCDATCNNEFCGDGTVQSGLGEVCDDGNTVGGDGCSADCTSDETCGNGIVDPGEECDDGNTVDDDLCSNACTENVDPNELVNGYFSAGTAPWVFFTTGMGTYQVVGGEAKLTFTTSGLSVVFYQDNVALAPNTEYTLSFRARHSVPDKKIAVSFVRQTSPFPSYGLQGQSFPLTTTMESYSVNFTTTAGVANDGRLRFNLISAAAPDSMLWFDDIVLLETAPAVCGNGVVEGGEQCDDGNTANGDGCDSTCQIEPVCGNGIVEAGEQCDDGNTMNGDGCDSNCQIEVPVCGNGIVDAGEECDDGNLIDGDGCDSNCTVTACGNGITTPPEECDDGNANDNDACANDCTINSITNAIVNGDFSAGEPPWIFFTNATGTFDVVDGEGKVTFGDNGFNVQLYQRNIAVDGNTDYTLTFRARHTGTPRRIQVRFARHTSPFTFYGLSQNVDLTSTMETYTLPFTTTNDVITDGRLMFILGRADRPSGAMFIVDDVVLAPTSPSTCGNGVLDPGETCDGANLDGETCSSQGLDGGTLACNATCDGFDTSGCFDCGNGVVDGTEECDGSDLDGETCSSQGFDSGTLSCTGSCTFNTGACATCGDGVIGGGEECDDGNTTSGDGCSSTCQTEGGGGPNLIRNPNFSSGEANWRHSAGTGSSDFSVVGGQAFVEIFVGGNNLQVYQSGITLQPNTTYRLTFDGRNTGGDDIRARVIRHSSPYTNYGLNKFVNLTQSMQTFTMTFTTPASVASARLQLWFNDDNPGDNYYFDNFVLELD